MCFKRGSSFLGIAWTCAFFVVVFVVVVDVVGGEKNPRTKQKKCTGNGRPSDGEYIPR